MNLSRKRQSLTAFAAIVSLLTACAPSATCDQACADAVNTTISARNAIRLDPFLTCVRHHESDRGQWPYVGGYSTAENPRSTASGAYQFLDSTWTVASTQAGYGGYRRALDAPDWIQDAVAYDLAIVRGQRSHWHGTGCAGS